MGHCWYFAQLHVVLLVELTVLSALTVEFYISTLDRLYLNGRQSVFALHPVPQMKYLISCPSLRAFEGVPNSMPITSMAEVVSMYLGQINFASAYGREVRLILHPGTLSLSAAMGGVRGRSQSLVCGSHALSAGLLALCAESSCSLARRDPPAAITLAVF